MQAVGTAKKPAKTGSVRATRQTPPRAASVPSTVVSHIDVINESGIYGWAYDAAKPESAAVLSLHIDGRRVADVCCGALRPDVAQAGHPTAEVGFRVKIPRVFCDGGVHVFSLLDGDGRAVEMGDDDTPPATRREFTCAIFFDEEFYAAHYMSAKPHGGLHEFQDWKQSGAALGRFPNVEALLAACEADGRGVPADFAPQTYRFLNPDLAGSVRFEWQAALHYIQFGRDENRQYKVDRERFIRDLYFDGGIATAGEIAGVAALPDSYRDTQDMLARNGVTSGAFLAYFKVEDYVTLNLSLRFRNTLQCIRHFVETGRAALCPISLAYAFDPPFYRSAAGLPAECNDADAYLHWLNFGADAGIASCGKAALHKIGLTQTHVYPRGFNPAIYAALNADLPDLDRADRWALLESAVGAGVPDGRPGCNLDDSTIEMFRAAALRAASLGRLQSARRIHEKILLAFPADRLTLRQYADCLTQLEDHYAAAQACWMSIGLGHADAAAYRTLSACCMMLQRWEDAADAMCRIADARAGDAGLQRHRDDVLGEIFDRRSRQAVALAERGFHTEARSIMREACLTLTRGLDSQPVGVLPPRAVRHVAIVADMGLPQCRLYRVTQKCEQLAAAGITSTVFSFHTDIPRYLETSGDHDALILYRATLTPLVVRAVQAARQVGIPVFYEIDDLMFDETVFPDSFESYGGQIAFDAYGHLTLAPITTRAALSLCDFAIGSTPSLTLAMAPLTRRGQGFTHCNALGHAHHSAMAVRRPKPSADIRLFYGTGTKAHNADFQAQLVPCLLKLFAKHGSAIRLVICGFLTLPDSLAAHADKITRMEPIWDIQRYWDVLRTMGINIAVLNPGAVADCKSEIKWLEAAMLGIPSVVTATATYAQIIRDGDTGVLVHDAADWFAALDGLIASNRKRHAIGARAREEALRTYDSPALSANIAGILRQAAGDPSPLMGTPRLKILIVNVFFPPQSFGGATRVVADNIRDLIREAGEELEIEVFTSVEGGDKPYQRTAYRWEGVRVTGIATPQEPDLDHKVSDEEMGRAFEAVLLRFQPALIHFHCIQRLTPSLCSVAIAHGVPYVITAHDAWWISEEQFVVDEFGHETFYDAHERERNGDASNERMIVKRRYLQAAARIFSVSEPFSRIYAAHGADRVVTVENGSPPFTTAPRSTSRDGRVRLAHIGGTSFHKGYNLVMAVLSGGDFPNLHHTQIDHSLEAGTTRTDRWGTTDVLIRSTVPQSDVGSLYADIDVLLAPSIWPESYGLVAREALSAGCWVIASDRGAIGADIPPGAGFVIDVGSQETLRALLKRINDDPERYTRSPGVTIALRPARQQALDLLAEYRAIIGKTAKRVRRAGGSKVKELAA